MKKVVVCFLIVLLLIATTGLAQGDDAQHIKLLAVKENANGTFTGSDADLFLEIRDGSGRIFLETNPLTKIDTQISTRYAKEIACNFFKLNCDRYDFIYTIKSDAHIIGGPSAGAAIAALTAIVVLDLDYDPKISITGTINSGGLIGPVGGVKEKLEAASKGGLRKIMIPLGSAQQKSQKNNTNETSQNLIKYAKKNLDLDVVEVTDLNEVVLHLTGKDLNHKEIIVKENTQYKKIMQELEDVLCTRTSQIQKDFKKYNFSLNDTDINKRLEKAINATAKEDYYSAASYCFTANINLRTNFYHDQKPNNETVTKYFNELKEKTITLEKELQNKKITKISDLQTMMVVKERINDVKIQLEAFNNTKNLETTYNILGYAQERYFSAVSWMQFFEMEGKKVTIDENRMRNSCLRKFGEATQSEQYVNFFIDAKYTQNIKNKLAQAQKAQDEDEYELCLIMSAQAKADANAILSSFGLNNETEKQYLNAKTKAVERIIAQNSEEDIFPILGYSYYRYANSLKEDQTYIALTYLEYALEMSDLSIYFPEKKFFPQIKTRFKLKSEWIAFGEGIIIGIIITILFLKYGIKPRKHRRKIHKRI